MAAFPPNDLHLDIKDDTDPYQEPGGAWHLPRIKQGSMYRFQFDLFYPDGSPVTISGMTFRGSGRKDVRDPATQFDFSEFVEITSTRVEARIYPAETAGITDAGRFDIEVEYSEGLPVPSVDMIFRGKYALLKEHTR